MIYNNFCYELNWFLIKLTIIWKRDLKTSLTIKQWRNFLFKKIQIYIVNQLSANNLRFYS
ncbi:hypothetical protein BLOT_007414 [Blomia tropicalis]|nr:hypothetical protein BLOT_007414 [Blomia tropicalis]